MKLRALIGLIGLSSMASLFAQQSEPLQKYRWEYRLLIYNVSESDTETFQEAITTNHAALTERHVRLIALSAQIDSTLSLTLDSPSLAQVRKRLQENSDTPTLYLIGKDGGLKQVTQKIKIEPILQRIDSMPMRQAEMRQTE